MVNNEKEEGSTKSSIKLEVKISTALYSIAHCQIWINSSNVFGLW